MCDAVQAELGALLDEELPEDLADEVRRHASRCPACAAELEQLRAVRARVRRAGHSEPRAPESLRERVQRLARREHED